jgi:hypothetical protein
VASHTRVVLIWDTPTTLEMRVTKDDKLMVGSRGFSATEAEQVFVLGDPDLASPILASVYSVGENDLGTARILAELRITPATCGRSLRLATVVSNHGAVFEEERQVAVPLCGTSGDILVLKNLVPTLKLATPK